jgi:hypothetical protein
MTRQPLTFLKLPGTFAVCRLGADAAIPPWAMAPPQAGDSASPPLLSITRTANELSIVAPQDLVDSMHDDPAGTADRAMRVERDFIAWRVAGTLDFSMVGVLAKLTAALADAGVPVFVISTFDTDVLLVPSAFRAAAGHALAGVATVKDEDHLGR